MDYNKNLYNNIEHYKTSIEIKVAKAKNEKKYKDETAAKLLCDKNEEVRLKGEMVKYILNEKVVPIPTSPIFDQCDVGIVKKKLETKIDKIIGNNKDPSSLYVDNVDGLHKLRNFNYNTTWQKQNMSNCKEDPFIKLSSYYKDKYGITADTYNFLESRLNIGVVNISFLQICVWIMFLAALFSLFVLGYIFWYNDIINDVETMDWHIFWIIIMALAIDMLFSFVAILLSAMYGLFLILIFVMTFLFMNCVCNIRDKINFTINLRIATVIYTYIILMVVSVIIILSSILFPIFVDNFFDALYLSTHVLFSLTIIIVLCKIIERCSRGYETKYVIGNLQKLNNLKKNNPAKYKYLTDIFCTNNSMTNNCYSYAV